MNEETKRLAERVAMLEQELGSDLDENSWISLKRRMREIHERARLARDDGNREVMAEALTDIEALAGEGGSVRTITIGEVAMCAIAVILVIALIQGWG